MLRADNIRLMVAGPTGAGKTTLLQKLGFLDEVKKTQMAEYGDCFIDTPGELLNHLYLYRSLLQNANKAKLVLFLADPLQQMRYPPKFHTAIRAPVLGVVTKTDLASSEAVQKAKRALVYAGTREVMLVSSKTGEGLTELRERIESIMGGVCPDER